ncbi:MAG: flavodoxin family protein [Deltaproteobacteria bacterium]|nr:flavodoxin family protein [Deltaproteobacteria bacterium]
MRVMAINGSPRKEWNTGIMLKKALEGAESKGAETEIIHLYDYNFKGCTSCFACKIRGGKGYGTCGFTDEMTPVYERIKEIDVLILGSPIYFGDVTGELRSFIERLLFPYLVYSVPPKTLFPKKIGIGLIYTMNCPEEFAAKVGYDRLFTGNEQIMNMILGKAESLMSYETYQFKDYSKVVADGIDEAQRRKRREEVFPIDCEKAFKLGAKLVEEEQKMSQKIY